jgi:hypothetical protein
MGDETGDKVIEMNSRKSSLLSMLDRPPAEAERAGKPESQTQPEDENDELPGLEEGYAACSRLDNKPQLMLCLLKADDSVRSYSYSDLRAIDLQPGNKPGNGPGLILRFVGVAEVRIEGRRLRTLVDYLRRHRIGWLRELPAGRDFRDGNAMVITRMEVKEAGAQD